jgi:hypothetical protein
MIEIIFTVDYEIYGKGEGSLRTLAFEPTERLRQVFSKWDARFVAFPDVAELEVIEAFEADPAIELIRKQLKDIHREGFEIGLHIHPWWYNARREKGQWMIDLAEYNLCTLPLDRINRIIDRAIAYIQELVESHDFIPLSFRAGHLLFQPTRPLSKALADRGIKLDSSVYRGGLWRQQKLDYRHAPKCEPYWRFTDNVISPEPEGAMIEIPIYTRLAPIWELLTSKRVGLQRSGLTPKQTGKKIAGRLCDIVRLRYPKKFDLGQMTNDEMVHMMDRIIKEDGKNPSAFHPVVVIMHTKDPIDLDAVDSLLAYLRKNRIKISTLSEVYEKIIGLHGAGQSN